jgi:hypothetical protein
MKPPRDRSIDKLDRALARLDVIFLAALVMIAGFAIGAAVFAMFMVGGGREALPARFVIAIVAMLVVGGVDRMAGRRFYWHRWGSAEGERQWHVYARWSFGFIAIVAILLFGMAWYLP